MSDSIFRFYSYNENHLHSLSNLYLWFSKLKDFNDPFEGCFHEEMFSLKANELDDELFIRAAKNILSNQGLSKVKVEEILVDSKLRGQFEISKQRLIDEYRRSIKIFIETSKRGKFCCFLQSSKNNPAEINKQMWSYYSDGLRGFMIEFDSEELRDGIIKANKCNVFWAQMHYGIAEPETFKNLFVAYGDPNHNIEKKSEELNKIISRKDSHWEYENELRFQINDSPNNKFHFSSKAIKKIVIGEKMPEEKLHTLVAVLKSIGIDISKQLYVCKINEKTISLDIVSYYDFIGVNKEGRDK